MKKYVSMLNRSTYIYIIVLNVARAQFIEIHRKVSGSRIINYYTNSDIACILMTRFDACS